MVTLYLVPAVAPPYIKLVEIYNIRLLPYNPGLSGGCIVNNKHNGSTWIDLNYTGISLPELAKFSGVHDPWVGCTSHLSARYITMMEEG